MFLVALLTSSILIDFGKIFITSEWLDLPINELARRPSLFKSY